MPDLNENDIQTPLTIAPMSGAEKATSNLQQIFKENCELINAANVLLYDGSAPAPELKDCENATVPENVTATELKRDNEVLGNVIEQLNAIDMRRVY